MAERVGCVRREAPDPERDVSPVEGSGAKRLILSETLVEPKGTQDQAALFLPRPAPKPGLKSARFGVIGACPGLRQPNRSSATRVFGALSRVVLMHAIEDVGGHAGVVAVVRAFQNVARPALRVARRGLRLLP